VVVPFVTAGHLTPLRQQLFTPGWVRVPPDRPVGDRRRSVGWFHMGAISTVRFVAEAPELHDHVSEHLRTCPSPRRQSVEAALRKAAG